ncbi:MAG: diguanylate cyclase (GGDEF)-like protein [Candidatus Omnitrophota bacterium]|jgi:diguanylate cyclase (GGDEF)-like protein
MASRQSFIPSFFIPIVAFGLWTFLFFSYLPVLESDLDFSRQIILANLYLANIILILTWFLCGKLIFVLFSATFSLFVFYLMLSLGDLGLGAQLITIVFLYLWLKHITKKIDNERIGKMMIRERVQEKLNLSQVALEEKKNLVSAIKRKLDRLDYMRQFSDNLKGAVNLNMACQTAADEVAKLIPEADQVLVYVADEDRSELGLMASWSRLSEYTAKDKKGNEFDEWVIKRSQPLLIEDTHSDFRFNENPLNPSRFRSLCLVPLLSKNRTCGVLHLATVKPNVFHTDDLRLLDIVADLSAVVVRNMLLYEKTKALSIIDSLTECYLLRYVRERMSEEVQRSLRHGSNFAVVMADIDYFKQYNDVYGHRAGDLVLRKVADILKTCVGPSDILGRYGGEEFILVLPQKTAVQAMEVAERIRVAVSSHEFVLKEDKKQVTISLGVSEFPLHANSSEELIDCADRNLYKAKSLGRNKVCGNT